MILAELRRLLINPRRFNVLIDKTTTFSLTPQESHYLSRVLRLKYGDFFEVSDGYGNLWRAVLLDSSLAKITSTFSSPERSEPRKRLLVGLAVVVPKRGFEEALRMSCELGVDIIQPLTSERRTPQAQDKFDRWDHILSESVEQSERLWKPTLQKTIPFKNWLLNRSPNDFFALAVTRKDTSVELSTLIKGKPQGAKQLWIAIGPEGGWSSSEESLAFESSLKFVQLSNSILRTPTAFVVATHLLVSLRNKYNQD